MKNELETKMCRKCFQLISIDKFSKSSKNKDGLHSYCKKCQHDVNSEYSESKKQFLNSVQKHNALSSLTDKELFNELKRRGFSGKLIISKTVEF